MPLPAPGGMKFEEETVSQPSGSVATAALDAENAALPSSPRCDFDDPSAPLRWRQALHSTTWHRQSYAIDAMSRDIYCVQTKPGSTARDLWVTKTGLKGTRRGSMALRDFGQGVQIAVEPAAGGGAYVWTDRHA